jgi:two-component system NtrC family response regulator
MLSGFLSDEGHQVSVAGCGEESLELIKKHYFDLVLLDQKMPGMDGLSVLAETRKINPELDVILVTAYGTVEAAVKAMKSGANDYLSKPIDLDALLILINRITERRMLLRENEALRRLIQSPRIAQEDIVFTSEQMAELVNLAGRVAPSNATVLIRGESGTGKELLARLVHNLSPRAKSPMIVINCAALPEPLLESELFGHEKGAFTGAVQRRQGHVELADGGTLFLDEIGELAPSIQVKLLRFLQEGEYQRVGDNRVLKSDVRVICATHRDLENMQKTGMFREDLFFRINVIPMQIPPLRERRKDIPLLVNAFVTRLAAANNKTINGLTQEAMDQLVKYDYPGNVRELENIIERAVVICRETVISIADLPFTNLSTPKPPDSNGSLHEALEAIEREMISKALADTGGNQTQAAKQLGIGERTLRYRLKKLGLK